MPHADILLAPEYAASVQFVPDLLVLIEQSPLPGLNSAPQCATTSENITCLVKKNPILRGSLVEAGLWLLAGQLDRSHTISQSIDSADGSYWHGIMHRREGDFSNANYWFRRVGRHPVLSRLTGYLSSHSVSISGILSRPELYTDTTVAEAITDGCQQALAKKSDQVAVWQSVCWMEWQLLFLHCLK
jgi:hypothetical protein